MKGALEAASEFFEMPSESKAKFSSPDISKPVRYDCSNDGINKSRSFLKHYAHPLDEWIQFWPVEPPSYRYIFSFASQIPIWCNNSKHAVVSKRIVGRIWC